MKHLALALLLVAALPRSAAASDIVHPLPDPREEWLTLADTILAGNEDAAGNAADPLLAPMNVCEERGCVRTGWQSLTGDEAARLRALFATETTATAEREHLGTAIALLETAMGGRNGTWRDHAANEREAEDEPGQMDCIAESINTRTYLDRLNRAGLIRHHRLDGFIHRYTVVLQHVAVEMTETARDEHFAVDSWVGANGAAPAILPYGDWRWEWGV